MDEQIKKINGRLKAASIGVSVFQRGSKLSLRAMLPPKPGSNKTKWSQQTIALNIFANPAGIKRAEAEARRLGGQLACKDFNWAHYLEEREIIIAPLSINSWIEKFERDYFAKRAKSPESETTWKTDYKVILKKLPTSKPLTKEVLLDLILETKPDSKTRKRACMVLSKLARFAGIDLDLSEYVGNYSPRQVSPRDIPSDKEIAEWYDRIPQTHGWKYAFGLMAAYGLRNYEIFDIDLQSLKSSPGHATVWNGQHGSRVVWCLYPEWWEKWELYKTDRPLPKVTGKTNADLGNRVTQAFRRYGFNKPYNLRHAWAIRSLIFNVPVEMAARMMDHSLKVHCEIYQHWINKEHYRKIYSLIINRSDRPSAP